MLASCIALAGYLVLREYLPYRNPTDNTTALLAQGVVFLWCFFLVLRDAGVFDGWPPAILGTLLTLVTVTVWCHALRCAYVEAFAEVVDATDASNYDLAVLSCSCVVWFLGRQINCCTPG